MHPRATHEPRANNRSTRRSTSPARPGCDRDPPIALDDATAPTSRSRPHAMKPFCTNRSFASAHLARPRASARVSRRPTAVTRAERRGESSPAPDRTRVRPDARRPPRADRAFVFFATSAARPVARAPARAAREATTGRSTRALDGSPAARKRPRARGEKRRN